MTQRTDDQQDIYSLQVASRTSAHRSRPGQAPWH